MYGIVGYGSNGRPDTIIQASMLWGLNSNENHLELSDKLSGVATRLVNYEPSLYGGYRRI